MLENLQIWREQRVVYMLFSLFDRRNNGYFGNQEFADIIDETFSPNFKKIVLAFPQRYEELLKRAYGKRKQPVPVEPEEQVIVREKVVPKYVDKIVYKYLDDDEEAPAGGEVIEGRQISEGQEAKAAAVIEEPARKQVVELP